MKLKRIELHPLFLMKLVHMIRIGQFKEAIALGGSEARIALNNWQQNEGGQDEDGGIMIVPSPTRLSTLNLQYPSDAQTQPKGPKP